MRLLVTGNLGYIGTLLTPMLAQKGHEVWGLDNGYFEECIFGALPTKYPGVHQQLHQDIRDIKAEQLVGFDAVLHLAALSNDPTGELNPELTEDINWRASIRLAELAKAAGVSRFLFASSCSIYGQSGDKSLTEDARFAPLTAYARSKVNTEADLAAMADDRFSPVFLRNGTAYGLSPRLRCDLVVNNLTGWAFTTGQVKLLSDGKAWRPIVHIKDISFAFLAALTAPQQVIHNQAFNVGQNCENYQIRTIADIVGKVVPNSTVTYAEGAAADNRTYNVCFDKINKILPGFRPVCNLEGAVRELYEAFKHNHLTLDDFQGRCFTRLNQLHFLLETGRLDDNLRWK
jgi:nucleoside-diphosphate-sugar epimerase